MTMTAWITSTEAVQAPAVIAPVHRLDRKPMVPTSSRITSEADSRFCAYWRSSSKSKAGRVPVVEVSRSRASRTYCAASRRRTGELSEGTARSGCSLGMVITNATLATMDWNLRQTRAKSLRAKLKSG